MLKISRGMSVDQAINVLKASGKAEYVEPNYMFKLRFTPNDPYYHNMQWNLNNWRQVIWGYKGAADADIDGPEGWDIDRGETNPATIAVIDSGIDENHGDLDGALWTNTGETAGNGVDDDGNGYIDDVNGYNWAGISNYTFDNGNELLFGENPTNKIYQEITGTGEEITSVGFMIKKTYGWPGFNIDGTLRSSPDGPILASFTMYYWQIDDNDFSEVIWGLNTPVILTDGTKYYIQLDATGDDPTEHYQFKIHEGCAGDLTSCAPIDAYGGGDLFESESGAAFSTVNSTDYADLYFVTNRGMQENPAPPGNSNPRDDNGHGTHVSGIAAAETNNATGIAGVSHGSKIMALKVSDSSGLLDSADIISSINYAANNGADVINMSFGGVSNFTGLQEAIDNAYDAGAVLVAAAGNSGSSAAYYPASNDNVLGVSATDNLDQLAWFSTYGSAVDISAPGHAILSTMPTYTEYSLYRGNLGIGFGVPGSAYEFLYGTSMAAPHVSGAAGLVLSQNPTYTPEQVENTLLYLSDDLGVAGKDTIFGYGRLNIKKALLGDTMAPSTPTISSTTHRSSSRYYRANRPAFTWSSSDKHSAVAGYSYVLNRNRSTVPQAKNMGSAEGKNFNRIRDGVAYLHVRAVDVFGN